jgi:predicted transcriptional regulator
MRRSKLETYIAILSALANKGPMKMTHIMYKANINGTVLRDNLDFLIKQKLIEERTIKREHVIFAVTQRGVNVLKYFKEVTNALEIIETRSQTSRTPLQY